MEQNLFEVRCNEKSQAVSRRRVLALMGAGGGAAAALLAGCSLGGGSDTSSAGSTTTASQTTTQPPTQAPAQGSQPNQAAQSGHSGTVIGQTSLAANSAKPFTDAANNGAILIHLAGGSFVAYETACTHEGVTVNYDPATQKLICPRHQAIFDPANGAAVVSGPAPSALPKVGINVNGDGTITTMS